MSNAAGECNQAIRGQEDKLAIGRALAPRHRRPLCDHRPGSKVAEDNIGALSDELGKKYLTVLARPEADCRGN